MEEDARSLALSYAAAGLSVIPIKPRDKAPITVWGGHQAHRATPDEIESWWIQYPRAGIGIIGGASAIMLTLASKDWPLAALGAVCVLLGAASLSWNGILLAEVARLAGPGKIGVATGGVQSFMSLGAIIGPIMFSALVAGSGHYATGFFVSAVPVLVMGVRMMAGGRKH